MCKINALFSPRPAFFMLVFFFFKPVKIRGKQGREYLLCRLRVSLECTVECVFILDGYGHCHTYMFIHDDQDEIFFL